MSITFERVFNYCDYATPCKLHKEPSRKNTILFQQMIWPFFPLVYIAKVELLCSNISFFYFYYYSICKNILKCKKKKKINAVFIEIPQNRLPQRCRKEADEIKSLFFRIKFDSL